MDEIRSFFPGPVGYSDHTAGTAVPLAAVARGAMVLEKHITLDRDVPNAQDWKVSCDPTNFATFIAQAREIEASLGKQQKEIGSEEQTSLLWARKSLHAIGTIAAGQKIEVHMLTSQRPGTGISPAHLDTLVGRSANEEIAAGTMIHWNMIG
jgi:N-acetylneuraminate synthase/N,N'-diacetyllegionaminate synthase